MGDGWLDKNEALFGKKKKTHDDGYMYEMNVTQQQIFRLPPMNVIRYVII